MLQYSSPQIQKKQKHGGGGGGQIFGASSRNGGFCRERRSDFSLEIRVIRPSAVFGTRREAALDGEGFAWVPDLWSFLKL